MAYIYENEIFVDFDRGVSPDSRNTNPKKIGPVEVSKIRIWNIAHSQVQGQICSFSAERDQKNTTNDYLEAHTWNE